MAQGRDACGDLQRAALACRLTPGDDGFEALYRLAAPAIRRLLRRIPPCDREDVESAVWLRIFRYRAAYDPREGAFLQWAAGIARRQACEYWRRRATGFLLPGDDALNALPPVAVEAVDAEVASREAFRELLSLVDERSRMQLFLHYSRCMTLEAIALRMGMNVNTVRSNVSRARRKIAAVLERRAAGDPMG